MIKDFVIKTYVDGTVENDTVFIDINNPIEVGEYTYTAQRMGAVPSISATIKSFICLDSYWNKRQYIVYNNERYFVFNTPTSSKKNTDGRYEYTLVFYSERYDLNGIYFFDVVGKDSSYAGGYISNSTTFSFFGTISEFAERLQATLDFNSIDYTVVVDDGISSDPVAVSFDNTYILEALQESFDLYNVPYYFKDREIHFGYTDNAITEVFEYGNSLLEITKTNANYKQVTYCSGIGSEDNIPYYYPNESDSAVDNSQIPLIIEDDLNSTADRLNIDLITNETTSLSLGVTNECFVSKDFGIEQTLGLEDYRAKLGSFEIKQNTDVTISIPQVRTSNVDGQTVVKLCIGKFISADNPAKPEILWHKILIDDTINVTSLDNTMAVTALSKGEYDVFVLVYPWNKESQYTGEWTVCNGDVNIDKGIITAPSVSVGYVFDVDTVADYIENVLIPNNPTYELALTELLDRTKANIAKMSEVIERMPIVQNLMPSIFRKTETKERFYPAKNNTYLLPDGSGDYYEFENEYDGAIIKEQVVTSFDDIKPTIEGITNSKGEIIATITAFAYDDDDNDDFVLDEAGNPTDTYQHPYFYIKLKKFDGVNGFNLFGSSIDSGEMTINMRSGNLAGTSHIVQSLKQETLAEFLFYNPVQVDTNGNLLAGNWEDKIDTNISNAQPQQQNTQDNEIWIAVTKDIDTYGVLMPNVNYGYKPTNGDEFNITNIFLPQGYITAAEKRLEDAIIQYMWENNSEKFNFTIKFSRVFLAENPSILSQLNENARLAIKYDNKIITSYISTYSYKSPTETDSLPEITVTITDTIAVQQGALQNSLTEIKNDILNSSPTSADFLKEGLKYFLRKDVEDTALAPIKFAEGAFSKDYREGGFAGRGWGAYQKPDGTSVAEFDEIIVRKTATFNELIINQISFTLGQTVFTNGGFEITNVVESDSYFRCYYDNKSGNRMAGVTVGDFIRCQEYDQSYSTITRYYSRLVVAIGLDYVDLSKTVFSGVGEPQIGDNCVQWGNETDANRQFAIIRNVTGGGYDQFLWGIDSVNSVGKQYYFVGWRNTQDPTLQFGDENIGGLRCVLGFTELNGIIVPNVTVDIWANSFSVKQPNGSYIDIDTLNADASLRLTVQEQRKTVANESSQSTSSFNRVYNDTNIGEIEKGNLSTSYEQLTAKEGTLAKATEALLSAISPISEEIKSAYELAYTRYSTAYADFNTKLASGEKSISNAIGTNANEAKEATEALKGIDVLVDLTHLAEDKYYPVVLKIGTNRRTTISVRQWLDSNNSGDPSWATHSTKDFAVTIKWEVNGSGWGAATVVRNVFESSYLWTLDKVPPAGLIGQLARTSEEYIYCRGGAKYYFNAHDGVAAITEFIVGEEGYTSTANQTASIKSIGDVTEPFVIYKEAEKLVGELEVGGANLFSTSDIELGKIDIYTGALSSASNRFRNKSYIPLTRTSLSISQSNIDIIYIYYDSDKAFIGSSFSPHSWIDDKAVTVPDGVAYIKLYGRKSDDSAISEADLATFKAMIEEATKSSTWRLSDADIAAQTTEEIKSVEQQSYDNIASNLGYTSYEDMEADKAKGETIIKGGSINADLIDTETLIVKNVYIPSPSGDEPIVEMNAKKQKFGNVEIDGVDSVIKKEGSEEVAVRMSSGMLSDVSGVGANWNSGTAKQGVYSAPTLTDVKVLTIGVVPNNGTKLTISGNLLAQSKENSFPATQDTEASISMELRKNGVYYTGIGYAHAYKFAPSTSEIATDTIEFTDIVDAGTYEVYVRVRGDVSTGGSFEITMSGQYSNLVASWVYDPNVDRVELAADGLGVMANSENHIIHKFREENGSQVLDITEKTTGNIDRAGLLLSGKVSKSGAIDRDKTWGFTSSTARASLSGSIYTIFHEIGHTRYVASAVPYAETASSGGRIIALVIEGSETLNSFQVRIVNTSTGGSEMSPFSFRVEGYNLP